MKIVVQISVKSSFFLNSFGYIILLILLGGLAGSYVILCLSF